MALEDTAAFQLYTSYIVGMLAVGVVTVSIAAWAYRRRVAAGAVPFFWTMVLLSVWCLSDAMAVASTTPGWTLTWIRIQLTAAAAMPVAWWLLTMEYTRHKGDSRETLLLLSIIPLITTMLVWTDSLHGLVFRSVLFPVQGPFTLISIPARGPWYWVHTAYSYSLLIVGTALMISSASHSRRLYKSQVSMLAAGVFLGLAGSMASVFYFAPQLHIDVTPVGFAAAAAALARALFRHNLFDVIPVARSTLIDRMADAMFALDRHQRVVELNPVAARIVGRPADELVGRSANEVLQQCPMLLALLQEIGASYTDIELDLSCDGREYDVRIASLGEGNGDPPGWLVVMHDITARAETQRDLQARNEDLDEFARTVAHDLKSPLTMIVGYADLMAESAVDLTPEELSDSASIIRDRAIAMSSIIDNLLLLASTRQLDVPVEPLDMAAVVQRACDRLAPLIEEKGAQITLPSTWPVALGHAPWIEEVWVNYLSNAIKYGGKPPRIVLGADPVSRDGGMPRFWIRDDGPGIAPEDQEKLFAPFTRLGHRASEGHGLGLSIVRRIVQRLGGQVAVSSEAIPGEGSVFSFTLPADL